MDSFCKHIASPSLKKKKINRESTIALGQLSPGQMASGVGSHRLTQYVQVCGKPQAVGVCSSTLSSSVTNLPNHAFLRIKLWP